MAKIHLIPTEKPSRLIHNDSNQLCYQSKKSAKNDRKWMHRKRFNLYITDSEEIKEGVDQWYIDKVINEPYCSGGAQYSSKQDVIILTTDPYLIADGIQAIDDTFLQWFVQNPSCEEVEVILQYQYHSSKKLYTDADYVDCNKEQYNSIKSEIPTCPLRILYKIIIPHNKEAIEEAAENYANNWEDIHPELDSQDIPPIEVSKIDFIQGAKSEAARDYWYEQFNKEQNGK